MRRIGRKGKEEKTVFVLQPPIQEVMEKSKQNKIFQMVVELSMIFFSAYVAAMGFLSGFGIEVQKGFFVTGLVVVIFFHYGNYILKMRWRVAGIIQYALYIIIFWYLRKEMALGFLHVANYCCRVFNDYYGTQYSIIWGASGRGEYFVTIFMLGFFMIVSNFLTLSLCDGFRRLLYLVCTFPFIVAPIFFGIIPKSTYFAGYVVLLIGVMGGHMGKHGIIDKKIRLRISLILVITGICLFFMGSILFSSDLYHKKINVVNTKHKMQAQIEQFSRKDFWEGTFLNNWIAQDKNKAYGGLNGGKLGRVDEVLFSEDIKLKLYGKDFPEGKMYLRGFIGTLYKEEHWEAVPEEIPPNWTPNSLYAMDVEVLNGDERGILAPYGIKSPTRINDGGFIQMVGKEFKKRYTVEFSGVANNIHQVGVWESDYMGEMTEDYLGHVLKTYRDLPPSSQVAREWENKKISHYGAGYYNNAIMEVKKYLSKETRYSLSPGMLPEGKDFIDYFLLTNKVGYCTHYASAATIMFRALGIPARYVEGYVVATNQREEVSGQKVISIKDTNAHAWTEIFQLGYGWVPVETTPGYTEGNVTPQEVLLDQKGKSELEKQTPIPSPTQVAATVEKPVQKGGSTEKKDKWDNIKETLKFIGFFTVFIALLIGIWYGRKQIMGRKFQKIMGGADSNAKVLYLYTQISRGLELCGVNYSDNREEYVINVQEKLSFLREGFFDNVFEIVLKARFSTHGITRKEEEEVLRFYKEFIEGVIQYGGQKEKIAFRCYL